MKVRFIKDIEYDVRVIWHMLSTPDPAGEVNRAKSMGFSEDVYKKIFAAKNYRSIKPFLMEITNKVYKEREKEIDKAIVNYQRSWDEIGDVFSKEIEKATQHKWFHRKFEVVVSPFHPGVSSSGGNKVIRLAFEDADDQRRITAHEILMSHLWSLMFERYPESMDDKYYIFGR